MKKNGFIATSLIYSFFLIFITLFLTIIADYLQNKVLLNTIEKGIKDEINDSMGIRDFEVGDVIVFASGTYSSTNYDSVISDTESWIVSKVYIDNINVENSYLILYSYGDEYNSISCLTVQNIYDDLNNLGYLNDTYLNKTLYNFKKQTYSILDSATNSRVEYNKNVKIINSTNITNYLEENLGLCRKRIQLPIGTDRLIKDSGTLGDSITLTGVMQ